ncbi:MAG: formate/nitrite transporter family protein [Ruminococcus sp.]|nr:formate/nitrite transporter family protein [Ruminococcus sp.]
MMKFLEESIKSILAGIAISIGGIVYLSCENKVVGAVLFSLGLIAVVSLGLSLYTGRIGYVLDNNKSFFAYTMLSIVGNVVGCIITGIVKSPVGEVEKIVLAKLEKAPINLFVDAVFCGILIYICVEIYKKKNTFLAILFCVPAFILCGFEHSIADTFYIVNARVFSVEALVFLLIVIVGNGVGGLLVPAMLKLAKPKSEN